MDQPNIEVTEVVVNPTDPGSLLPAKWRALIYVFTVMAGAAYAVVEANADLHYAVAAGYAAWNAGAALLAVANIPPNARQR